MKKTVKNLKGFKLVLATVVGVLISVTLISFNVNSTKVAWEDDTPKCPSNYPAEIERERVRMYDYQYYLLHTEEIGYVDTTGGYTVTKLSVNEEEGYFTVLVEGVKEEPYEWRYTLLSDEEAQERLEIARAEYEEAKRIAEEWRKTDEYKEYSQLCGLR